MDRALRALARRRAGLDAEEARWLREAESLRIWRELGMSSAQDYMERVLGYAPRTGQERLRVARALGALPRMTAALSQGELGFSAVRELTRVAIAATEDAWVERAIGKSLRQVEELVADHRLGDHPDEPKDPAARTHVVRLELTAETFALLRQARQVLDDEHGTSLSEDRLVAQLCNAVLDGTSDTESTEPTGRAKFQVAVTVCERCKQGWQHGAGAKIAIGPAAVERALCDAHHIGSIDGAAPERAYQDVTPRVARLVWHRDGGRCRVPGCRSARGIEIHHLVHRADGGGHDPSNLVLTCSSCHQSHHAGVLSISGTADRIEVRRPAEVRANTLSGSHDQVEVIGGGNEAQRGGNEAQRGGNEAQRGPEMVAKSGPHVGVGDESARGTARTKLEVSILREDAKTALKQLGWKPGVAHAAVAAAASALGAEATLERLLVEALRRCPQRAYTTSPQAPHASEARS